MPSEESRKEINESIENPERNVNKTSSKTARESLDGPLAEKYDENFETFSNESDNSMPLILEDPKTGEKYYDASDRTKDATDKSRFSNPIKEKFTALLPDFKTMGAPGSFPRILTVEFGPQDNALVQKHFTENLHGRDPSKLSEFDRSKLSNLAICDTFMDKYQRALTDQELQDTKLMPQPLKGLFLAGTALEDGVAVGAARSVIHKVIDEGAIGDLASGTAMGLAFGKVVTNLATNVNPWVKGIAVAMQAGGVAVAIKQFSEIGHEGINGFLSSVPALQELAQNPSEKTLAHAKEEVDQHLGPPFADTALVGLGFVAAKGMEKIATKGGKGSKGKNKSKEAEEQSNKKQNTSDKEVEKSSIEQIPPKGDFSVEGDPDNPIRTIKFGDFEKQFLVWEGFLQGKAAKDANSPIKLHVMIDSAKDLGRVQKKLIPEIHNDPILNENIAGWKTIDPLFGTKQVGFGKAVAPTGKDQGAKGFTIYTRSLKEAMIVQKRLDEICRSEGIGLNEKPTTGNCESVAGMSNRIGVSRDTFRMSVSKDGSSGAGIDEVVADKIHSAFGLKPGQPLSKNQLHLIEKQCGIKQGLLTYSKSEELMLKPSSLHGRKYHRGWYAPEAGAGKSFGERTERPALYALYSKYGFDPADPKVVSPELRETL